MEEYNLSDSEFQQLRQLIYQLTGISLAESKRHLVKSRLQKRLIALKLARFKDYYNLLLTEPKDSPERTAFINCVTTNKTDFFRERHHFDFVTRTVVPELASRVAAGEIPKRIRVWHAGCSTGEEPYTLAITLREALAQRGAWDVRQLASDIDTGVLAHAERGVYERERVKPVPDALLRRYFLSGAGAQAEYVKVRKELQEQITFRQINLLDDPWPMRWDTRFDIIFCRNVVIYFDKPTQKRLFARFEERLHPGGYLFIGHSESLLGISDAFESLGQTIYRLPEHPMERMQAA